MASEREKPQLSQLWQVPLLIFSVAVFGYAAWLLLRPGPGPSVGYRLDVARTFIKQERAEAAIALLNELLGEKLSPVHEGAVHMMLGEALEMGRKQKNLDIPEIHARVIRQTEAALELGIAPDAATHRRLADAYKAIGRPTAAIEQLRKAMALDKAHAMRWQREVITLQFEQEDREGAAASIEAYLKMPELAPAERAWALGEKAHLLIDRKSFNEARELLTEALKLDPADATHQGQFHYWMGYSLWKLSQAAEAERHLRVARDLLKVQHPLEGEAAYALGRIHQEQKDWAGANSFYAAVLQGHMDRPRVAIPAQIGRGVCRIASGDEDAGLADMQEMMRKLRQRESVAPSLRELMLASLQQSSLLLSASGNCKGALELMALEQEMEPKPPADFFARMARLYERRANQLESAVGETKAADRAALQERVRENRARAGDGYIAFSRALTLRDDKGYGIALWKGIELYEAAADLPRAIRALETFVGERPEDSLTPDAYLRLGQSYHAAGLFDKAIGAYRNCQFRYARSLAASKAGVPLARAYIAKGPDSYRKAEDVLKALVENNPQVTPDAQEFRESLLELANLYYRTGRYELGIAKLEEITQRYPEDDRMGQLLFLMADSYRKSAVVLEDKIKAAGSAATTKPELDIAAAKAARLERLTRSRELFERVIDYYRSGRAQARDLDKLYLKLSHFYRADCVYEAGQYAEAIKLYDDAAFRYQDDPSALAAYVQIVNAYVALGRIEEAKAANERAKWMLRRIPADVFEASTLAMPKTSWEAWLRWSGEAGMWKN